MYESYINKIEDVGKLRNLKPGTIRTYQNNVKDFLKFINKHPDELTCEDARDFLLFLKNKGNTANYEDFSDTEYLFGGTSIKREAGKDLSIDCALEVTDGTAKVFWISGADEEVTLLETTGTYSDTITLPEGGNYIGIECENFTGSIELNME